MIDPKMEYDTAIKNVCEGFLLLEKCSQHNSKWKKLDQSLFYIMLNIYWEEDASKC